MAEIRKWARPISFVSPLTGDYRTIESASDAIAVLRGAGWPVQAGKQLREARKICVEVIDGKRPPAEARRAFIAAAVEAHVFVKEK
ncbi:DUF982 domain-containing protein [Rhizobium grahamii]|uniref:DUF982 domain-containing protein n=1 Tax=Rhizobium grahamii CCGE 502 TaxID=990285 RepID=S3HCS1_9HYPH|nr:DUF982 domain-containing protein [Rhizobium grahamii]EPE96532.1 hypothetical protein RGCCGE502_20340 [Rhizobium grahamii CCGE 502]